MRAVIGLLAIFGAAIYGQESRFSLPAAPGSVTVGVSRLITPDGILSIGTDRRSELILSPTSIARLDENTSIRMIAGKPAPAFEVLTGRALIEVIADEDENAASLSIAGASMPLWKAGLFLLDADTETVACYDGKLRVNSHGRHWTVHKGHSLDLKAWAISNFDRDAFARSDLFNWSKARSRILAKASEPTADQFLRRDQDWYGPGWYWNFGLLMYTFLPSDGTVTDAFGARYCSPFPEFAPRRPFGA